MDESWDTHVTPLLLGCADVADDDQGLCMSQENLLHGRYFQPQQNEVKLLTTSFN